MFSSRPRTETVTPEGWTVEDDEFYHWCIASAPPRPRAYLRQLAVDATRWQPLALWAAGFGLLALAAVTGYWLLVLPGVLVLVMWFRLFHSVARSFRDNPLLVGTVSALGPHPLLKSMSTASALLADSRSVQVALPTLPAAELLEDHPRAEVLFLYDAQAEYGFVIGVRAAPRRFGVEPA